MNPSTPALNYLGTRGKKVIVECGGHVFSVPLEDVRDLPLSDKQPCYAQEERQSKPSSERCCTLAEKMKLPARSDSFSEASDSEAESSFSNGQAVAAGEVSRSASQVANKLKDEVIRLIDESILKIEQYWAEKTLVERKESPEMELTAAAVEKSETMEENTLVGLHPDGDRGQLNHREQNLQVLHTKSFQESKRQTRVKLLDEIHVLVDRLKDMETLEQ